MASRSDQLARMADEDLMALIADADADAYEVVYDRHADAAFALAHRILGSRAAADDACQDAWMAAWRSASRYDPRLGSVRSWLLTVVHHRAIDHVRRMTRLRDRTVADDAAAERVAGDDDTEALALAANDREVAAGLLEELSSDQRAVVELAFYSGYSHSEIADILDLPLGTVKGRMRAGLEKLRHHLEGAGR
jgi:RNA polymerase sigma-70 factor (ECF subfamily)